MDVVKCEIISKTSSDDMDAYVLSESSMFVSPRRFILKTCGTTTPLACLPLLVSFAFQSSGHDAVQDLYYSRKNFKRPELQVSPHRSFKEEAAILDALFSNGRAYCMGSLNRADCWYLYTASLSDGTAAPLALRNDRAKKHMESDQTLEVLMTDLDKDKMAHFFQVNCGSAAEATRRSGIDKLVPGVVIDDYLFEPCGYSMNGVMRSVPGGYMTIHITPEPAFSYVSFETNIPQKSYKDLILRVIKTFGPKQFVVTFFSNSETGTRLGEEDKCQVPLCHNYDVSDVQVCQLPGYDLTYALYNRTPS
ncbi:S-adenosylmethionine decarboxylase proenzyme-like [Hyalella azteca]|uniref:adenosylmethionine decarboxylase n=1 Tax=Hyalella azteca TaxID=294128 RepID=A0A8B7P739_HYAAZ|nr:S-adenosylmethionine decarboxylase proenzyme-like [Hyalella azteca]